MIPLGTRPTLLLQLLLALSLFPDEGILTKEIASWEGFANRLPDKDNEVFKKVLNDCYKYSNAINAKGRPFPTEPMIMALLFSLHKMIEWLTQVIFCEFSEPRKTSAQFFQVELWWLLSSMG